MKLQTTKTSSIVLPWRLPQSRLAVDGGLPLRTTPYAPWPLMSEEEVEAASAVLRSGQINYWTGEQCRCFEAEFAEAISCPYAIAVANGTVALELALYALGIGPGDEVIVPSRTFFASASCVVMRGAVPIFADVDATSQTLTAESIEEVRSPRTRALIAVHLAGWPCDMDSILELAREHGIMVIEDCAQAHGALYKGRAVGSMGDAAAFSFCQDKIVSTGGEGGMMTTRDEGTWRRAWSYKDHGKVYELTSDRSPSPAFRWVHRSFGTNWRLTEMQAAIGRSLCRKLQAFIRQRQLNAGVLTEGFAKCPELRVTTPPAQIVHAYYKYYVFLRTEGLRRGWTRERFLQAVRAEGIPCSSGSCSELYMEAAVPEAMRPRGRLPVARQLGESSLMFLVHPTLSEADLLDAVLAVQKVLSVASTAAQSSRTDSRRPGRPAMFVAGEL